MKRNLIFKKLIHSCKKECMSINVYDYGFMLQSFS